jgi:hypothetical protein
VGEARLVQVWIRPDVPMHPSIRTNAGQIDFVRGTPTQLQGWSVRVRGQVMFLVSPRGWGNGVPAPMRDPKGKHMMLGPIPLTGATLVWEGDDAAIVDKLQRYDSPALTSPTAVPEDVPVLNPKEMGDP